MSRTTASPGRDAVLAYRPLVMAAAAASLGITVDRHLISRYDLPGLACWSLVAVGLLVFWVVAPARCRVAASALPCVALGAVFGLWAHLGWNYHEGDSIARMVGENPQPACLDVTVVAPVEHRPAAPPNPLEPTVAGPYSETIVDVRQIRDRRTWRIARGRCRLRVAGEAVPMAKGQQLRLYALIARPFPTLNPGQYDWAAVERGQRRIAEIYCPDSSCVKLQRGSRSLPAEWLESVRGWCRQQLCRFVDGPAEDLALAVLLGDRAQLDDERTEAFLLSGTIHLLVISGLHIGMLAVLIWGLLRMVQTPRRLGLLLTAVCIVCYALIIGPRPPVLRATLLTLLALFAAGSGRKFSPMQLLAAALLAVLAANPQELWQSGTQLSFLSVAVLIHFGQFLMRRRPIDPLERLCREAEPWGQRLWRRLGSWYGQLTAASLAVWLLAAPLVAYHFHLSTPGGIAVSPLLWPLVACALGAGATAVVVGWAIPPVGYLAGDVCRLALAVTQQIVEVAEQLPIGHFYCPGPALWWLLLFYATVGLWAVFPGRRPGWPGLSAIVVLLLALGWASTRFPGPDPSRLRCTFLAMGHGTCAVVELPGGQTLLYDAGSLASAKGASRTISSFLFSRGISHLDGIVISHADIDHYNAVPGLIDIFPTDVVYVSPLMFLDWQSSGQAEALACLREGLERRGVELRQIGRDDRVAARDEQVEIVVLHPPRQGVGGRDNANSVVLAIEYAGRRLLLPGDLESPGLEQLIALPTTNVDILLAPHHGSAGSDPPGFAAWCRPKWVVVSGGDQRRTKLATRSYEAAGARVLHTSVHGATEVTISPRRIAASTYR